MTEPSRRRELSHSDQHLHAGRRRHGSHRLATLARPTMAEGLAALFLALPARS